MLNILAYSCEMPESKKIHITVKEDRSEAKAICAAIRPAPATIQPEPRENDIITGYITKYLDKDPSVVPLIVELLRGKDFKLKKRILYAIKNIRYSNDWNFRVTEPILIERRIVPMLCYFQHCDVFGDVEKIQTLTAKYDFRNA